MERFVKIKFIAAATIVILMLVAAAIIITKDRVWISDSSADLTPISLEKHKLLFYDQKLFFEGVDYADRNKADFPVGARGGIIPHHLFTSFIISDFFSRLAEEKPKRIILVGPNHKEAGIYKVLSSEFAWDTPFGVVSSDKDLIDKLRDKDLVHIDENVLEDEHSVAGIMPYIKYYLPNAEVVPFILRSTIDDLEITKLAKELANAADKDTFIIASVDFSHYLDSQTAAANDKKTLSAMQNYDYDKLYHFGNDNLDSPASIAVILKIMQALNSPKFNLFFNTNSGLIDNSPYSQTTSYFSGMFN